MQTPTCPKYYCGIDPSLRAPGFALLDAQGGIVWSASYHVAPRLRGAERLYTIITYVHSQLHMYKSLTACCIEGPSLGSTHREYDLGEISGALKTWVYSSTKNDPIVIPPTQLKRFATGFGQAKKEDMLHAVKQIYPKFQGDDNEADAIFLARLGWALHTPTAMLGREAREVLQAIQRPKSKTVKLKANMNI